MVQVSIDRMSTHNIVGVGANSFDYVLSHSLSSVRVKKIERGGAISIMSFYEVSTN